MGVNDKPFACTNEGCQMTFTNEDHLNVHKKKHDMILNFGITCKNNVTADQTPTPTRFIRNCEEVGLFQDLQNVNPFEETFKKAIEDSRTGTIHIPDSPHDDSLHTPQILHQVSENAKQQYSADKRDDDDMIAIDEDILRIDSQNGSSKDEHQYSVEKHDDDDDDDVIVIDENILRIDLQNSSNKDDCLSPMENCVDSKRNSFSYHTEVSTSNEKEYEFSSSNSNDATVEDLSIIKKNLNNHLLKSTTIRKHDEKSDVKEKIKEVLLQKSEIKPLDLKLKNNEKPHQRINLKTILKNVENESEYRKSININDTNLNELEQRKARNRMAQMRCRKRKKMWLDRIEQEIEKLKKDNKSVVAENQRLKQENALLKSMLLKHTNCSLSTSLSVQNGKIPVETGIEKKTVSIQPLPLLCNTYAIQPSQINFKTSQVISVGRTANKLLFIQKSLPK